MAVTPETGAPNGGAVAEMTPDGFTSIPKGGTMTEDQAVDLIANRLGLGVAEDPGEEDREEREEPQQEATEEETQEEQESEEEETDKTEPEEGETEELPETLEALAEALEMNADDLADHIKVKVKVNGRVSEVPLGEAVRGYQREQDYSRKTSEVSEQRKQIEAQQQAFETERSKQLEELGVLHQALSQRLGGYTAEAMLRIKQEYGEDAYLQAQIQKEHDQGLLEQVRSQAQKVAEEHQKKMQEFRSEQQRLLADADPDFRDTEKARQVQDGMARYLKDMKFTDDEISGFFNGPFDHRQAQIIRDAVRYRELVEKSKSVGQSKPKPKPKMKKAGSADDHKPPKKLDALRQRVRRARSGSRMEQRDANVALISEMIREGK